MTVSPLNSGAALSTLEGPETRGWRVAKELETVRIELTTSCMLSKLSTTDINPQGAPFEATAPARPSVSGRRTAANMSLESDINADASSSPQRRNSHRKSHPPSGGWRAKPGPTDTEPRLGLPRARTHAWEVTASPGLDRVPRDTFRMAGRNSKLSRPQPSPPASMSTRFGCELPSSPSSFLCRRRV